ncbi:gag/pol polyprotein [Tanacetum coccineum]
MHAPVENHWSAVKRILCYLHGMVEHGMLISRSSGSTLQAFTDVIWKGNLDTSFEAFSDADWVGDSDDQRSMGGFAIYLGSNLISWTSHKQRTVSHSSTKAEYKALADTVAELTWLQALLNELGIRSSSTPILWCDNLGIRVMRLLLVVVIDLEEGDCLMESMDWKQCCFEGFASLLRPFKPRSLHWPYMDRLASFPSVRKKGPHYDGCIRLLQCTRFTKRKRGETKIKFDSAYSGEIMNTTDSGAEEGVPNFSQMFLSVCVARLQFPVGIIGRFLKNSRYAQRVGTGAPVYLAAILEYLAAKVLELA